MSTERELAQALAALMEADDAGEPLDNELLASRLGWELNQTAVCLASLKERSFIWGLRAGRTPGPWYSEMEVTVQGRRFLRTLG